MPASLTAPPAPTRSPRAQASLKSGTDPPPLKWSALRYGFGNRRRPGLFQGLPLQSATTKVALGEWAVCLSAAHPGYISWEQFMANQQRLADNTSRYAAGHTGAPRQGSALLQGIAVCGRCGRRMSLRYT